MAKLIMLVGGSRSGKSLYAEQIAAKLAAENHQDVYYLATATIWDDEFAERVKKHQQRRPIDWHTLEEACELGQVLGRMNDKPGIILIDGIGTWVANLMYRDNYPDFSWNAAKEKQFFQEVDLFIAACQAHAGTIILVADEVGMAIVPENEQARIFRDLNGWANQALAQAANECYMLTCGIPVKIK